MIPIPMAASFCGQVSPLNHLHPAVRGLHPYRPGRSIAEVARERGIADVVKLSSNENPLGAGALALDVLRNLSAEMFSRYPPDGGALLTNAIADVLQVKTEQVILGNGSNDILSLAGQLVLSPGAVAVYSANAFLVYGLVAAACGAGAIVADSKDGTFEHNLDALAKAAQQPNVRLVFIANPNNPTGGWHSPCAIGDFLRSVPGDVLVVLDEAYCDYLDDGGVGTLPLLGKFDNLLITRTFSKIHGLAGLRAGFGIGNKSIINALNTIRQPFNMNIAAQTAARAALEDTAHLAKSRKVNREGMQTLRATLDKKGLPYLPSFANFLTFATAPKNAAEVYEALLDNGVIVRRLQEYQMPNHLRATIGTASENNKLIAALHKIIG